MKIKRLSKSKTYKETLTSLFSFKVYNWTMRKDFKLKGNDGKTYTLDSFKGNKVILYFYPKNNTPGCTLQATEFTKYKEDFQKFGYTIVGVSNNTHESHCSFAEKHGLEILLLSDVDRRVAKEYGAVKSILGVVTTARTTFLLDDKGNITREMFGIKAAGSAEVLLKELSK